MSDVDRRSGLVRAVSAIVLSVSGRTRRARWRAVIACPPSMRRSRKRGISMSFSDFGLAAPILEALAAAGYEQPTDVQRQAVPAALTGADLLVSSQTGSGKTAAFMLPSLQRLAAPSPAPGKGPRILVLTPTRELAMQVNKAALTYGGGLKRFRTVTLVGGSSYAQQLRMLERPVDLVVATPGRLIDHMQRGRIDFDRLEVLVLDEADRMLDMGFVEDIDAIVDATPPSRQTLLFSATLDGVVGNLARRLTRDPQRIDVAAPPRDEARIEQILMFADDLSHKTRLLDALLRNTELNQAVVFASTKAATEEISGMLQESGFAAAALHGDMHQGQRNRTLQGLREGRTRVLVATDVAARGIDVAGVSHVINFDSPRQAEDYVHRIGRTGRAGRTGVAITLMHHNEGHRVRDIERYTGQPLRIDTIPGLEPVRRPVKPHFGHGKPGGPRRGGPSQGWGGQGQARSWGQAPGRGQGYGHRDGQGQGQGHGQGRGYEQQGRGYGQGQGTGQPARPWAARDGDGQRHAQGPRDDRGGAHDRARFDARPPMRGWGQRDGRPSGPAPRHNRGWQD